MLLATEIRKGMVIRVEGELFTVLETQHITPGNWRGMVKAKMRNLKSGSSKEVRFNPSDKFEQAMLEQKEVQFTYKNADHFVFMDLANYEEIHLDRELIGDAAGYLLENSEILVNYCDNAVTGVQLPTTVDLKVTDTEPGLKSATVTNVYKPATLETGMVIQVPPFVNPGEKIRVDTRTGEYVERVK
ncbi:MAG: elongation factor P [Planctomycetes bacterium]|nr:elongation factor P [Planctomycetota bacterium]